MSEQGEDALRAACAAGEPAGVERALELLSSPHAYDRGVASEALADTPPDGVGALERALISLGSAPAWRTLALRAERGVLDTSVATAIDVAVETLSDVDARYFAVGVFGALGAASDVRQAALRRWAVDADAELAIEAAGVLIECTGSLPQPVIERLARVRGVGRPGALLLRADAGDPSVTDEALAALPGAGPLRFELLRVIERTGRPEHAGALERVWRRWRPDTVAVRAAAAAAVLGDDRARSWLDGAARSRRVDVRAVARAELVRVGTAQQRERVLASLLDGRDASDGAVVSALPEGDDVASVVARVATRPDDADTVDAARAWLRSRGRAGR